MDVRDTGQAISGKMQAEDYRLEFRGRSGEFFRIWIVNTLLTLLTLGVYSAWAKVRANRYFYGNTFLGKSSFGYHARPLQILKGRLILALGLAIYLALGYLAPGAEVFMLLVMMLLIPWLLVRSLMFRMGNTSYRNIRFGFDGSVKASYWVGIRGMLVTVLTLGLGTYWADWLRSRFIVNNLRFGRSSFYTQCKSVDFLSIYLRLILLSLLALIVLFAFFALAAIVLSGLPGLRSGAAEELEVMQRLNLSMIFLSMLVYLPVSLYLYTFLQVRKFNLLAKTTQIGEHELNSDLKVGKLFRIYLVNLLGIIFSLGLLIPWARIRTARYRLERVGIRVAGSLDNEIADEAGAVSATGEEIGDYMDLDLGF